MKLFEQVSKWHQKLQTVIDSLDTCEHASRELDLARIKIEEAQLWLSRDPQIKAEVRGYGTRRVQM
jgi:hypothetical protein